MNNKSFEFSVLICTYTDRKSQLQATMLIESYHMLLGMLGMPQLNYQPFIESVTKASAKNRNNRVCTFHSQIMKIDHVILSPWSLIP